MKKTVMTINEVNNIKQLAELAAENGHITFYSGVPKENKSPLLQKMAKEKHLSFLTDA